MKNAVLFLIILFQASYASSTFSVKFNSSNNCPTLGRQSATSNITQSFISIRRHQQQSACDDYNTGEERIFEKDEVQEGLGGYAIRKNPDGSYTASMALRFFPAEDYDFHRIIPHHRVHQHYRQKMRNCMKQVNPYILGPNGERLKIEILEPRSNSNIPAHHISIQSSRGRSTSRSYESDISCQVMTHEIMHLLGLKDEYPEMHAGHSVNPSDGSIGGYNPSFPRYNFDCRVTQKNSIMSHYWDRFDSVNKRTQASLLYPIHFDAILYGQCDSREDLKLFRQCSELAYQNSQNNRNCHVLRRQCEAQDILGRQRQQNLQNRQDEQNDRLDQGQNYNKNNQVGINNNRKSQRSFIELSTSLNLTPKEENTLTYQINNLSPENARSAVQFLESSRQPPSNLNAERRQRWRENIENRIRQIDRRYNVQSTNRNEEIKRQDTTDRQQNDRLNQKQNNDLQNNKSGTIKNSRNQRSFIGLSTSLNLTPREERTLTNQINNLSPQKAAEAIRFLETMRQPPPNLNAERRQRWRENIEDRIRQLQGRRNELQLRNQREISTRQLTTPSNRQRQQNTRLNQKQNNNQSRSTTNRPTRRFIDSLTNPNLNPSEERAVTNQIDNLNIRQVRIAIQVLKTRQNDPNLTPEERANIESRMRKVQRRHNALQ